MLNNICMFFISSSNKISIFYINIFPSILESFYIFINMFFW